MARTRHQLPARLVDIGPAVVLGVIGQVSIWVGSTSEGPRALTVPVALVATAALAWRRRAPVAVAAVVMTLWSAQSIAADVPSAMWELIVLLLVAYAPGAYAARTRDAVAGGLIVVAGLVVVTVFDTAPDVSAFTPIVLGGAPWLAGRLVRRWSSQARELDVINAELERRRADDVRAATQQERARIARELHDVVAHCISVMVVQAGAAETLLETDPRQAGEALASIRQSGKGALAEMRRLLGVLREDAGEADLGPQPGIADLGALVERMRSGGLDVDFRVEGDRVALQPGPELAAYRVVQEALTNALKHGGPTRAQVTVRFAAHGLELDVVDHGGAVAARPVNGDGHGLIGMRERMALYGGRVEAGPREPRGGAVHATLPYEAPR